MTRDEIKKQIVEYMKMYVPDGEPIGAEKIMQLIESESTPYKGDETTINNLNSTVMRWIEKYMIEDYGRQRWNKMTREEQAIILQNFLNDLVKAIEKIREIKLKTPI
jgi:hypothetical protein